MRAWLCWLLLLVLPLQWAVAAAQPCAHGGQGEGAAAAVRAAMVALHAGAHHAGHGEEAGAAEHAGHHGMHATAAQAIDATTDASPEPASCSACGCCHLGASAPPVTVPVTTALAIAQPQPSCADVSIAMRPAEGLYRPPRG